MRKQKFLLSCIRARARVYALQKAYVKDLECAILAKLLDEKESLISRNEVLLWRSFTST